MKGWKRLAAFAAAFLLLVQPQSVLAEEPQEIKARAACLMDADSGRVLYGKDEDTPLPMASTTKIMTCILVLERGDLSAVTAASQNAASQPKVHLGVTKGEGFLVQDLLYSLMLESHNDSAVMLAEAAAGSVEAFAEWMNEKAAELGCEDTHFVTPNGLDGSDAQGEHHTTAADLARIMKYCIQDSPKSAEFLEITQTPSYTFWNTEKTRVFECTNHNTFLNMMDGALSGKTGFTSKAGYCYVGALQKDGRTFIVTLLSGNKKEEKWADTTKLMNYGLANYSYRDVYREGEMSARIPVADGQYDGALGSGTGMVNCDVDSGGSTGLEVLMRQDETVTTKLIVPKMLTAPVKKGETVGKKTYYLNGRELASYDVITREAVKKIDFPWCLRRVMRELAPF